MGCCGSTSSPREKTSVEHLRPSSKGRGKAHEFRAAEERHDSVMSLKSEGKKRHDASSGQHPNNGNGWHRIGARNNSASELPFHQYHPKPPPDWRDWDRNFSKKYEVKYEIGKGAYGSVWRATCVEPMSHKDVHTHSHAVAVKVVSRRDTDDFGWKMAMSELEVLKGLDHPNIVSFRDCYITPNNIITVMEMCRGGELLCSVNEHVQIYTEGVVISIMRNVLAGLVHIHEQGVCHRDLKPANLLLKKKLKPAEQMHLDKMKHELEGIQHGGGAGGSESHDKQPAFRSISAGRVSSSHGVGLSADNLLSMASLKESEIAEYSTGEDAVHHLSSTVAICDFGMAVRFTPGQDFPSVEGLVGSPIYCSPELLCLMLQDGKGVMAALAPTMSGLYESVTSYNEKCDIWSIGIVTYILLAGYHPLMENKQSTRDGANLSDLVRSIIAEDVRFDGDPWPKISDNAVDFVQSCLVRDYQARPSARSLMQHPWLRETTGDEKKFAQLDHPHGKHKTPLEMRIPLALKTGESFGVTVDDSFCVKYVRPGSAAARAGIVEGMELTGIVESTGRPQRQMSVDDIDELLHQDGGATVTVKGKGHAPLQRILEADGVDCNAPLDSNKPGLALLRLALQEKQGNMQPLPQHIIWDQETMRTGKEVRMTIESSLDPRDGRNLSAVRRLVSDLHEHHGSCSWFVHHDQGTDLDDYINDLENYQSHHVRFSVGARGFLVIGAPCSRDKVIGVPEEMCGKELNEFKIDETNLPGGVVQQLFTKALSMPELETEWVADFLRGVLPKHAWVIVLGSIMGQSDFTDKSAPHLKFTLHHKTVHCVGFDLNYLRRPHPNQLFPLS